MNISWTSRAKIEPGGNANYLTQIRLWLIEFNKAAWSG
jgi:hypothetical protein